MDGLAVRQRSEDGLDVLVLDGELTLRSAVSLRPVLAKALLDVGSVALDLSGLELRWTPSAQVFVSTLAAAGGWPSVRLVGFGACADLAGQLRSMRIAQYVPLCASVEGARERLQHRPARVVRSFELPCAMSAPALARTLVSWTCEDWDIGALIDDAVLVANELVAHVVEHAQTGSQLTVTLAGDRLTLTVRDTRPPGSDDPQPAASLGLRIVAAVSRAWGVSRHCDGTSLWATV